MKTVVIYQSKYGYTKTYAQWIAEDLHGDLRAADKIKSDDLLKYDTIVYGGGLYAGRVNGIAVLTKNFESIKHKNLYLFTVGAMDVTRQENIDVIHNSLSGILTPAMLQAIHIYHLQGGVNYSKLSFIHRIMMNMMMHIVKKKPENQRTTMEKSFLELQNKDTNFTKRLAIAPLVSHVKSQEK